MSGRKKAPPEKRAAKQVALGDEVDFGPATFARGMKAVTEALEQIEKAHAQAHAQAPKTAPAKKKKK